MNRYLSLRLLPLAIVALVVACSTMDSPRTGEMHRWWAGFGLVVKHDTFPSDCKLCHIGAQWQELVTDFRFDHERETGVALDGAHAQARCLRCHNDRGPVAVFQEQGCAGCHQDVHTGELGADCVTCHGQQTWHVANARVQHLHSRLPLTGAHSQVACHRCHAGASVQNYRPTDPDCDSCHYNAAAATTNPPHLGLGWTDRCDRCHMPTAWRPAIVR